MKSNGKNLLTGALECGIRVLISLAILFSSSPLFLQTAAAYREPEPVANEAAPGETELRIPDAIAVAEDPEDPTIGSMLGQVEDATTGVRLGGVQVVAHGVLDAFPLPTYLPMMIASDPTHTGKAAAPALRLMLAPLADTATFTLTTDAQGEYLFAVPAGDYTLTYSLSGYTPDERVHKVRANEVLRLDAIRLHPQDPTITDLGVSGGTATNSLGNSSVEFPAGALDSDEEVRVTYVDNADLPGFFPDGSAPMGFSSFEPEGAVFPAGKEVVWTVEYTGTLPVGSDTLCYWWDGETQNWKDPVPGKVVDLGDGKKGLQAEVPHFSFYGHAIPAVAGQQPGQNGDATTTQANAGEGDDQFR
ncbi:MAG: carboxypeptidase regulatory-like domain-containing protein [Caldilineales bacterium]|nr:carboxypeptidase regulatory-like domain-containing protein [Caldilineales bacterium]